MESDRRCFGFRVHLVLFLRSVYEFYRSGDGTAKIWPLISDSKEPEAPLTLKHTGDDFGESSEKKIDVTTMEWSPDGNQLATGSYDGVVRIWGKDGTGGRKLRGHQGPIFALKWNRTGTVFLTGSSDSTAMVWNKEYPDPITFDGHTCNVSLF